MPAEKTWMRSVGGVSRVVVAEWKARGTYAGGGNLLALGEELTE